MLLLRNLITAVQLGLGIIPLGISITAVRRCSWPLALVALVGVYVVVAVVPLFRRRESLWVFFFTWLTVTPINIAAITRLLNSVVFEDSFLLTNILWGGIIYLVVLSIEELAFGLIARMLWQKQYKMLVMQE